MSKARQAILDKVKALGWSRYTLMAIACGNMSVV